MDGRNYIQRLLKHPSFELCGSKIYKTWLNNSKIGKTSAAYWVIGIMMGILAWVVTREAEGFATFVGLIVLALFGTLTCYDCDALWCFYNKKSEFYRATGVTREELLKDKGLAGEFNAYVLSKKIKAPHRTLYNVCVPMPNGSFQEVDAIIITPHEIYVLECKNRTGYFEIDFNKKFWIQHIGSQKHEVPNIYLQNQEHIIAIDHYLLSKEVIKESIVYLNLVLTGGDSFVNSDMKTPDEFYLGDMFQVLKCIESKERHSQNTHDDDFMDHVYMALLPYALNGKRAKESMIREREIRGQSGETARGNYRYYRFENVPDALGLLSEENALLRKDNVYTQIGYYCDTFYYWFTVPTMTYIEEA